MSVAEDTRKVLPDFLAPELRATNVRLDGIDRRMDGIDKRIEELKIGIDKRFDGLSKQMGKDKPESLRAIESMMRELALRVDWLA